MTATRIRPWALLLTACLFLFAPAARAATLGQAEVTVNRVARNESFQRISIPSSATDYETPPAELAALLTATPPLTGSLRVKARAVAGIDVPDGALYGNISTFARMELPGVQARAYADSTIAYKETFEVQSDTLPVGTPVDVRFSLMLTHMGSAGATGLGACCAISSQYNFRIEAGVPFDSTYTPLPTTARNGVLGGNGFDMEDIEFSLHFGPFTAEAAVGEDFFFDIKFEIESLALANAVSQADRIHNGQAEATATATLIFATEVVPAAAGFAAADALSAGGSGSGGSDGYLFHPTSGLRLPGLEALDPANVHAHLLPLVHVPEPSTFLLDNLALCGLCLIHRRPLLIL